MPKQKALPPEDLRFTCAPDAFTFNTTSELPTLDEIIGQGRALKAIEFGLGITNHNYNIFVLGEGGTGKETTVKGIIEAKAKLETVPDDWCCVFNFVEPDCPRALSLPPGKGSELASDMTEMVDSLRRDIPKVFESKDYEKHRDEIVDGQQERTRAIFFRLEQKAIERGLLVKKSVSGLSIVPAKDGKAMTPDEFDALPKGRREALEEAIKAAQDKLSDAIREARGIEKETKDRITTLDREVVQYVVNPLIGEMTEKFKPFPVVLDYFGQVKENILNSIDDFRPKEEMPIVIGPIKLPRSEPSFERYSVNLMVNNAQTQGAPVVFETNPTYYNLFGRIEYKIQFGVASTDFTMIKAGAVHKANGGYLIVNAMDVLRNIFVYDSLKRMIKNREVRMEDVWEQYRLVSSTTLKPAPIPVNIKLVLLGEPFLYYLLYNLDREYRKIFKVKADFDNVMPRTPENVNLYAMFVAARCKVESLKPFDRSGVGRIVEHGLKLSGDRERLSVRFNEIEDLIVESSYWAGVEGAAIVTEAHVEKACLERVLRNSKFEDKLRDHIIEDTLMVAVAGFVVGQINGMAVLDPGDWAFGKPSRITARVYMGDACIVNIEREVKMSGRIHNKALLILTGFLGERFAGNFPLTLSASICFEQLYDEVEGDSATCTEVYALLSSIAGVPINQGMAVTGSMNQLGEVQPIGGVNEKIEGFFDVCKAKGLTGNQGVVIPRRNVRNLMLKKEVIEAVKAGQFAVYPIDRVDEGLEILTGMTAGERLDDGSYPAGTINRLVQDALASLAKRHKEFGRPPVEKKAKPEENRKDAIGEPKREG